MRYSTGCPAASARRHMSSAYELSCLGTALNATFHLRSLTVPLMPSMLMYKEGLRTFLYTPSSIRMIS